MLSMLPLHLAVVSFLRLLFFRAALNAGRSSCEKGVRPSLRLSNAWTVTKRKKNQICPDLIPDAKDRLA